MACGQPAAAAPLAQQTAAPQFAARRHAGWALTALDQLHFVARGLGLSEPTCKIECSTAGVQRRHGAGRGAWPGSGQAPRSLWRTPPPPLQRMRYPPAAWPDELLPARGGERRHAALSRAAAATWQLPRALWSNPRRAPPAAGSAAGAGAANEGRKEHAHRRARRDGGAHRPPRGRCPCPSTADIVEHHAWGTGSGGGGLGAAAEVAGNGAVLAPSTRRGLPPRGLPAPPRLGRGPAPAQSESHLFSDISSACPSLLAPRTSLLARRSDP